MNSEAVSDLKVRHPCMYS